MIRLATLSLLLALSLSGCGRKVGLEPKQGNTLPVKPNAALKQPNANDLMTPSAQAKPERSDEQLKRYEQRNEDEFDLPPSPKSPKH